MFFKFESIQPRRQKTAGEMPQGLRALALSEGRNWDPSIHVRWLTRDLKLPLASVAIPTQAH